MGIKIQKVKIQDFKVLKNFEADIQGKSVFLIAENGRGKSSFMQAIQIALGNGGSVPEHMSGNGVVEVTKDGMPYTFSFKTNKKGKAELSVTLPNGLKEDKKGIINALVGPLSFDINQFVEYSKTTAGKKKQVEEYKKLLPQEFIDGIGQFELKVKNLYDERTEVGRKMETLKGFISESKLFGDDLKAVSVDVSQLNQQLEKINAHNAKVNEVKSKVAESEASVARSTTRIEELKAEIAKLEASINEEKDKQSKAAEWFKKNTIQDTSAIMQQINDASEINVKAAQAEEHNKKLAQYNAFKESYEDLTVQIEVNKQAISDTIKQFDSPVSGLEFNDDELIYNGVPVSINSMSTSEIIELGIKMFYASNPECGLMFVEHAESLGNQRLKDVLEYCKKYDIQAFYEEVKRGQDELVVEFINED